MKTAAGVPVTLVGMRHPLTLACAGVLVGFVMTGHACAAELTQQPPARHADERTDEVVERLVRFPFVEVDREAREVRVESTMIAVDMPIEFLVIADGGPDHEAVLRTRAKPSHVHAGLLLLGLEPGSPVRYVEATRSSVAPFGPPLRLSVRWVDAQGTTRDAPATSFLRSLRDGKLMPDQPFIFAGSMVRDEDGTYAADLAGYLVSIVNFELSPIDVPRLASSSNELLEWELNRNQAPPAGTPVTLIISPIQDPSTTTPDDADPKAVDSPRAPTDPKDVSINPTASLDMLRDRWRSAVRPHADALRDAAQTHYDLITDLRRKQQSLIDEADRIQRLIDELEREYQQLTTPRPTP
jgi:hypothetical protein